jgi:hypothetical protein
MLSVCSRCMRYLLVSVTVLCVAELCPGDPPTQNPAQNELIPWPDYHTHSIRNPMRKALWKEFKALLPETQIDIYAENTAWTEILFRFGGSTFLYSLANRQANNLETPALQRINCITFRRSKEGELEWVLWHNGKVERAIKADKDGYGRRRRGDGVALEQASDEIDKKREALWTALLKQFRKNYPQGEIDVYAESTDLTAVAFRLRNENVDQPPGLAFGLGDPRTPKIYEFRLKLGAILENRLGMALPRINRMTFGEDDGAMSLEFFLWRDGEYKTAATHAYLPP